MWFAFCGRRSRRTPRRDRAARVCFINLSWSFKFYASNGVGGHLLTSGNCVFTFPNTPIKCAGAPQKVLYYGHDIVRDRGYRNSTNFIYATSLQRLFGVEAYLKSLNKIAAEKGIDVRTRHSLIEVDTKHKIAKFELLDENSKPNGKFDEIPYSLLHIGPPCSAPPAIRNCKELVDENGWVDVDHETLRSCIGRGGAAKFCDWLVA
ncbi:hypothetical protein Y032_0124g1213 [Ancylostoma ceylanicum]|uniref:Sulfide:quinone oxidoreductase, mitochondrial n=1 Tax=Ancylostoma ceylanicum TaxID=53326 RepID=A0A016T9A6_9BILA|nr:hypothetical protein Y032_0124g1213 [Ancylostoma ceylanicum]